MNTEQIENKIAELKKKGELNRKQRRYLAKLEAKLQPKDNPSRFQIPGWIWFIIIVILLIIGWLLFSQSKGTKISTNKKQSQTDKIIARNGIHWHPQLTIIINGVEQEIPADIGITAVSEEEIHTHDEDASQGIIHLEMKGLVTENETRLGNFFKIWKKTFNKTQIFDKKNSKEGKVSMTVNGKPNVDFENYLMKDKDKIVIRYE